MSNKVSDILVRAIKTWCQTFLSLALTEKAGITSVDISDMLLTSSLAFILSICINITSTEKNKDLNPSGLPDNNKELVSDATLEESAEYLSSNILNYWDRIKNKNKGKNIGPTVDEVNSNPETGSLSK